MAYNYFVCRKHPVPVTYAALANPYAPGAYASPMCPSCGKTMQRYGGGETMALPPLPPDGPVPQFAPAPALADVDVPIYAGSGINPGHGRVTWNISRNAASMEMTIQLNLGEYVANAWASTKRFRTADGLITLGQPGQRCNWWLASPLPRYPDPTLWHTITLTNLIAPGDLGGAPAVVNVGVKLGDAAFGLIHLLAGHADAVQNIGNYSVATSALPADNQLRAIPSLQSGLRRFDEDKIRLINYDPVETKLLIMGEFSGLIVLRLMPGDVRFSITTLFNTNTKKFGTTIYRA